jgi:predicted ester cyclase
MSVERNEAVAAAVVERVMNRGDLEAVEERFAAGYVEHDVLPPTIPPGLEGMKQLVGMLRGAFPDLRYDIEDVVADGDRVVLRITGRGTMRGTLFGLPATGRSASWSEIHISRFAAGKVVEHWSVTDQLGMLQQLGLAPDDR